MPEHANTLLEGCRRVVAYLSWGVNERREVRSVHEMDQIVDHVAMQAASENMPCSVTLQLGNSSALAILVGGEVSHAEFYSPHQSPLAVGSRGPWQGDDGDEIIVCTHGGQYSEIEKRYAIPIVDAREGLRNFFRTARRPDNIVWG